MAMNVAIVRSADRLDYYDKDRELSKKLTVAAATDQRFKTATFTAVAWDKPNDWNRFSHILLSVGLNYSTCHKQFLNWLDGHEQEVQNRIFNPPPLVKWNMNKIYLAELKEKGVPLPATVFIPAESSKIDLNDILLALEKEAGKKVDEIVIKNIMDAGGHSVHRVKLDCQENGQAILDRAVSNYEAGVIVQEYLTSINSEGEWSVVFTDRKPTHAMTKLPCDSGFKVQGRYGGSSKTVEIENVPKDILALANQVVALVTEKKLLYARVDIVQGNDGIPKLMELEVFEPELYLYNTELCIKFLEAIAKY